MSIAAHNGHVDVIRALVVLGADVNAPNKNGTTAVHMAAHNGHANTIRTLCALGADVNTPDNDGTTPVFIAAQHGHVDAIKALVALGADVNTPANDGATPVLVAAQQDHADVIKDLFKLGADMGVTVYEGDVLGFARSHDNSKAVACIEKILNKMHSECECCGCSTKKLYRCGGCNKVRYCSIGCQKKDRKKHRSECKKTVIKNDS